MDPKKIGNLIYELRIKNNLTQKELADKLLVTSQAISKWENGRGIPDIEMIQKLSEVFEVDISELLSGNIKNKKSIPNSKSLIIGISIFAVIGLVLLFLLILKINDKTDFQISKLASDNDSFRIKGIIAYSNNKKSIYISKVDYASKDEQKEFINLECILYEVNGDVEKRISKCSTKENINLGKTFTLSELLEDVELNVDDYSCSCNTPVCNTLYLKINAINKNEETITYDIPIELESSCDSAH